MLAGRTSSFSCSWLVRCRSCFLQLLVLLKDIWEGASLEEDTLNVLSNHSVYRSAKRCEIIQSWLRENRLMGLNDGELGEAIAISEGMQVQCPTSNCNCGTWMRSIRSRDDSERDVYDREMSLRIDLEPALERRHCVGGGECW